MYVCLHVYIYSFIYTHNHSISMHTCTYLYVYMYAYINTSTYMHVLLSSYFCAKTYNEVYMSKWKHVRLRGLPCPRHHPVFDCNPCLSFSKILLSNLSVTYLFKHSYFGLSSSFFALIALLLPQSMMPLAGSYAEWVLHTEQCLIQREEEEEWVWMQCYYCATWGGKLCFFVCCCSIWGTL